MDIKLGKNGLFGLKKNALFSGWRRVDRDPFGEEVPETRENIFPKIPIRLLKQSIPFGMWGRKEKHSEVSLVLCQNPQKGWFWVCPHQCTSMGHVRAHTSRTPDEFSGWKGDIHTHPIWCKNFSGTDTNDMIRKRNGIYIVLSGENLEIAVINGVFEGQIFEMTPEETFDLSDDGPEEYPKEWEERVNTGECKDCQAEKETYKPYTITAWPSPAAASVVYDGYGGYGGSTSDDNSGEDLGAFLRGLYETWKDDRKGSPFICRNPKCDGTHAVCKDCNSKIKEKHMFEDVIDALDEAYKRMNSAQERR